MTIRAWGACRPGGAAGAGSAGGAGGSILAGEAAGSARAALASYTSGASCAAGAAVSALAVIPDGAMVVAVRACAVRRVLVEDGETSGAEDLSAARLRMDPRPSRILTKGNRVTTQAAIGTGPDALVQRT